MKGPLQVGDRVQYSRAWCRNTGNNTGELPFAIGRITKIVDLGSMKLAHIKWDGAYGEVCPEKVAIANLNRIGDLEGV